MISNDTGYYISDGEISSNLNLILHFSASRVGIKFNSYSCRTDCGACTAQLSNVWRNPLYEELEKTNNGGRGTRRFPRRRSSEDNAWAVCREMLRL